MPIIRTERSYHETLARACKGCGAPAGEPCVTTWQPGRWVCAERWAVIARGLGGKGTNLMTDPKPYVSKRGPNKKPYA